MITQNFGEIRAKISVPIAAPINHDREVSPEKSISLLIVRLIPRPTANGIPAAVPKSIAHLPKRLRSITWSTSSYRSGAVVMILILSKIRKAKALALAAIDCGLDARITFLSESTYLPLVNSWRERREGRRPRINMIAQNKVKVNVLGLFWLWQNGLVPSYNCNLALILYTIAYVYRPDSHSWP